MELPFDWRRRYRLSAPLGSGGMAEVWSAWHLPTGRKVAIKKLRAMPGQLGAEARARLLLEARSACAIRHPHVVELHDVVEPPGENPFIVMELLEGETLEAKLARDGSLSIAETARLLLPVVSAVGTAHSRGIVHRDLKPGNIFLCARRGATPWVKVLDFGIAKWFAAQQELGLLTRSGLTLGTPSYMAPEQALADASIDHRADVWALGVILYECLSGCRPLEGANGAQLMVNLVSSGIMPIDALVADVPGDLAKLIGGMLSRQPERRPSDLREVFDVLGSYCEHDFQRFGEPSSELVIFEDAMSEPAAAPLTQQVGGLGTDNRAPKGTRVVPWLLGAAGMAVAAALLSWFPERRVIDSGSPALSGRAPELPVVPLLLDDVEDLDSVPDAAQFAPWQSYVYNGPGRAGFGARGPGYNGNGSLVLLWHVTDPPNGRVDHVGAGLRTRAKGAFVDLSSFSRVVFSHRYEASVSSDASAADCKDIQELFVFVLCSEHETQYELRVPVSERWRTIALPFSEFLEPDWRGPTRTPLAACLAVADGLNFGVQATLADGECARGRLWLDGISLR